MSSYKHRMSRSFTFNRNTSSARTNRFKWVNKDLNLKTSSSPHNLKSLVKDLNAKPSMTTTTSRSCEARDVSTVAALQARIRRIKSLEDKLAEESEMYQYKNLLLSSIPSCKSSSNKGKMLPPLNSATKKLKPKISPSTSQVPMPSCTGQNVEANATRRQTTVTPKYIRTQFTLKKLNRSVSESPKQPKRSKASMKSVIASKYRIDRRTTASKAAPHSYFLDRRMSAFKKTSSYPSPSRFHWKNKSLVSEKRSTMPMTTKRSTLTCQTRGSRKFLFSKFKMRARVSDEGKVTKFCRSASNRSMEIIRSSSKRIKTSQHFYRNALVRAKHHLVNRKKSYCINYIRTGACSNFKTCQFVHEFDTIRICLRFLSNRCTKENCLLSHSADANRMPICSFFESGVCSRGPACPFLHIKHRAGTPVCADFMWSFCPRGAKCYKRHVLGNSSYVRRQSHLHCNQVLQPPAVKEEKEEKERDVTDGDSFLPLLDSDSESSSDSETEA